MKKILLVLVYICCFSPSQAQAVSGGYVALKVEYSFMSTETSAITGASTNTFDVNSNPLGAGFALGFDFKPNYDVPIRLELEWMLDDSFTDSDRDYKTWYYTEVENTVSVQRLYLNAYFDIHIHEHFVPYIGGGIGLSEVTDKSEYRVYDRYTDDFWDDTTLDSRSTFNFAWNLAAGLAIPVTENFALDFSYRYAQFGEGELKNNTIGGVNLTGKTKDINAHQLLFGLRFTF